MMTSGFWARISNYLSISFPPTSKAYLRSVFLEKSLNSCAVCWASSLVGERITALDPTIFEWAFNFSINGMRNAAVFPEPVLAIATRLKSWRAYGIAFLWMGVGILYPLAMMALNKKGLKLNPWNPPDFFFFLSTTELDCFSSALSSNLMSEFRMLVIY